MLSQFSFVQFRNLYCRDAEIVFKKFRCRGFRISFAAAKLVIIRELTNYSAVTFLYISPSLYIVAEDWLYAKNGEARMGLPVFALPIIYIRG